MAEAERDDALRMRVAALEGELSQVQTVLGRCVVTTATASLATLALGREIEAVIAAAGLTPAVGPLLRKLEEQVAALRKAVEDTNHAA